MKQDIKLQKSFANVKDDMNLLYGHVEALRNRVLELEDTNVRLISAMTVLGEIVASSQKREIAHRKPIKRIVNKRVTKFVASKIRNKIHLKNCVFAKKIKRNNKKEFASKASAKKAGYKLCKCLR